VETVRDLAQDDLWRESLERSRARRAGKRPSETRDQRRTQRARGPKQRTRAPKQRTRARKRVQARPELRPRRQRRVLKRRSRLARRASPVVGLALLAGLLLLALDGHAPHVSSASANVVIGPPGYAKTRQDGPISPGAGLIRKKSCPMVIPTATSGYVNPLTGTKVTPERIDQGVDYAGSGSLVAIGTARVTHVATEGTGWPGAFIEYRLLDGPDAGCHVFYAEGVTPEPGLRVGDTLLAGQAVATIIPQSGSGIEIGWGAGTNTTSYAAATHRWSAGDDAGNVPSGPGKKFSALIAALGGPPGKIEG
jgi:hypothetical protein